MIQVLKFSAKIILIGINPAVDPPDRVLRGLFAGAGRSKGPIPVRGRLNGAGFVQTLVKYRSAWRLYINASMLKAAGLNVGDTADIEIEFDLTPRIEPMPDLFRAALVQNPKAMNAFESLTPSRRKDIL
jgi:hypothetical protein